MMHAEAASENKHIPIRTSWFSWMDSSSDRTKTLEISQASTRTLAGRPIAVADNASSDAVLIAAKPPEQPIPARRVLWQVRLRPNSLATK